MKQRLTIMALPAIAPASATLSHSPDLSLSLPAALSLSLPLSLLLFGAFPAVSVHLNALLATQIALSEATIKLELNLVRLVSGWVC